MTMGQTNRKEPLPARAETVMIKAVLFDFGGVISTEGFREGLQDIARRQGLNQQDLHRLGLGAVYDSGYVLGKGSEADFWAMMRQRTGIKGEDAELTGLTLPHFVIRPRVIQAVRRLRGKGYIVAILSDQTDWIERLDQKYQFYAEFHRIFNSYRLGKGKRDPSLFTDVTAELRIAPQEALFIDDARENVERAQAQGLRVILFENEAMVLAELKRLPDLQKLNSSLPIIYD